MHTVRPQAARHIGDTPLQTIELSVDRHRHLVYLKREDRNPFGSVKDRTADGLLTALEVDHPEGPLTVVESTSGNLGAALAVLCRQREHRFVAVVDPKASRENLDVMKRNGAELHRVTERDATGSYLGTRIRRVRELVEELPNAHWTNQYGNTANPLVHYLQTSREILRDAGPVDAIFIAVSTGGTLRGISDRFRRESPHTCIVAVDETGSVALGGEPAPRWLNGIGASRPSRFVRKGHYDTKMLISNADAITACRLLRDTASTYVGGSSGAAVAACVRYLVAYPSTGTAVCVCPDGGEKYTESLYDDSWLEARAIDLRPSYAWFDWHRVRFTALQI